jgi:peptidyl-prolyl cis-trans isomerase A (cyclophilin A)
MKLKYFFLLLVLIRFSVAAQDTIHCKISTSMGDIFVDLYAKKAPLTVANYMQYVEQNLYDQSSFFRVCNPINEADRQVKIEVIQGGDVSEEDQFLPIEIETTELTGILHKNGTISMARSEPNSATCSFFICIDDQPELDFGGKRNPDGMGFAAFGKVTEGMDVVKKIQMQKDKDQFLISPIMINEIVKLDP